MKKLDLITQTYIEEVLVIVFGICFLIGLIFIGYDYSRGCASWCDNCCVSERNDLDV